MTHSLRLCRAALAMLPLLSCRPSEPWTDFRRGGIECVVVVFRKQATVADVGAFLDRAVSLPRTDNRGMSLRPGIASVIKVTSTSGFGYEICFSSSASGKEKATVVKLIEESPVVLRVTDARR
jgi:hypothetical protein